MEIKHCFYNRFQNFYSFTTKTKHMYAKRKDSEKEYKLSLKDKITEKKNKIIQELMQKNNK